MTKSLDSIKHSEKVTKAFDGIVWLDFGALKMRTGLDQKTLQTCLNRMIKNGHLYRDNGAYSLTEEKVG